MGGDRPESRQGTLGQRIGAALFQERAVVSCDHVKSFVPDGSQRPPRMFF
jgi:hypothetical protein